MVYPDAIGTDQAQILVADDQGEFDHWQRYLDMMAGDLRYVGANLRAAAALDMALLSRLLSMKYRGIYGAYLCESEGVDLALLGPLLPQGDQARR